MAKLMKRFLLIGVICTFVLAGTALAGDEGTTNGSITLIAPTGTISTKTPTYEWKHITNVTLYWLWVTDSKGHSFDKWYKAEDIGCTSGNCSVTPDKELAVGEAKWWIKAYTPNKGYGEWSEGMEFVVIQSASIETPTLISPNGTINTSTPTYNWNSVSGASWYWLWVDSQDSVTISKWYKASEVGCGTSDNGTVCSVTPDKKLRNGKAKWWIMAWGNGKYGKWSDGMEFKVEVGNTKPEKPTLISPTGTITTNKPTYQWNSAANATWYQLWVNGSRDGNKFNTLYRAEDAGCGVTSDNGTVCSITPDKALLLGKAYTWWVRAFGNDEYSPWSEEKRFYVSSDNSTTTTAAATLVSPTGTINTTKPTYVWNAVPDSNWYFLWVNDSKGVAKIIRWYSDTDAGCPAGTGTCSVTPEIDLPTGDATWWVRTYITDEVGAWSSGMKFTVSK